MEKRKGANAHGRLCAGSARGMELNVGPNPVACRSSGVIAMNPIQRPSVMKHLVLRGRRIHEIEVTASVDFRSGRGANCRSRSRTIWLIGQDFAGKHNRQRNHSPSRSQQVKMVVADELGIHVWASKIKEQKRGSCHRKTGENRNQLQNKIKKAHTKSFPGARC